MEAKNKAKCTIASIAINLTKMKHRWNEESFQANTIRLKFIFRQSINDRKNSTNALILWLNDVFNSKTWFACFTQATFSLDSHRFFFQFYLFFSWLLHVFIILIICFVENVGTWLVRNDIRYLVCPFSERSSRYRGNRIEQKINVNEMFAQNWVVSPGMRTMIHWQIAFNVITVLDGGMSCNVLFHAL